MDYKKLFWIFFWIMVALWFTLLFNMMALIDQKNYYKEYSQLTCKGFNIELEFIKEIYPEFAEKKCDDIRIILDNRSKSDIFCDQFKGISWPEKLDCENI